MKKRLLEHGKKRMLALLKQKIAVAASKQIGERVTQENRSALLQVIEEEIYSRSAI